MPVFGELTGGSYDLGDSSAKELSESVGVTHLTPLFAGCSFVQNVYDGGNPGVEYGFGDDCRLDRPSAGGGVETESVVIDGKTNIMTEDGYSFVRVVRRLLRMKKNEAWEGRGGKAWGCGILM